MPLKIADDVDDLVDTDVDVNQHQDYEFLGSDDSEVDKNQPYSWEFMGALVRSYHHKDFVEDVVGTTQKIIERARDSKSPPPPVSVVSSDEPAYRAWEDDLVARVTIFGADEVADHFPLFEKLYKQFLSVNEPKYVRLDTEDSYRDYRGLPQAAAIEDEETTDLFGAGEEEVPLSMPPWAKGLVKCWRKGDMICCSLSIPGPDGEVRFCTSATPVKKHVDEVVGYAHAVGGDVPTLIGVLPTIACMLGGGSLVPQMAKAVPSLLARPEAQGTRPFVGRMETANQTSLAALMALLQHAQSGDPQAVTEWQGLVRIAAVKPELAPALQDAKSRLVAAQGAA